MQLRVFFNAKGNLLAEVSAPSSERRGQWVVFLLPIEDPRRPLFSDDFIVPVRFAGKPYLIPTYKLRMLPPKSPGIRFAGLLEEDYSRNILNHIMDVLAWDP